MTTTEPLMKAAMVHLRDIWLRSIPFKELAQAARARISPGIVVIDSESLATDMRMLGGPIIQCYAASLV